MQKVYIVLRHSTSGLSEVVRVASDEVAAEVFATDLAAAMSATEGGTCAYECIEEFVR